MNEDQRKQIHIVLDLETMGIKQDAAIIEIGMVIFNLDSVALAIPNVLEQWSISVSLESAMKYGGTTDAGTLTWWMDPDRSEARDNWLVSEKLSLPRALNKIAFNLSKYSSLLPLPRIWGNGVNFDNAILKSAYERLDITVPWSYRQDADFRTLKLLYKDIVPEPAFVGTPHIALDDARHEAVWLSQILQYIYYRDDSAKTSKPIDFCNLNLHSPKIMGAAEASVDFKTPIDTFAKE